VACSLRATSKSSRIMLTCTSSTRISRIVSSSWDQSMPVKRCSFAACTNSNTRTSAEGRDADVTLSEAAGVVISRSCK
jgi:hypothetical protein